MFETLADLGEGTFGDVYLVENKKTLERFALKTLNKAFMIRNNRVDNVYKEKALLLEAGRHPHIVAFRGSWQDSDNLYYLLDFCENGSLTTLLER